MNSCYDLAEKVANDFDINYENAAAVLDEDPEEAAQNTELCEQEVRELSMKAILEYGSAADPDIRQNINYGVDALARRDGFVFDEKFKAQTISLLDGYQSGTKPSEGVAAGAIHQNAFNQNIKVTQEDLTEIYDTNNGTIQNVRKELSDNK